MSKLGLAVAFGLLCVVGLMGKGKAQTAVTPAVNLQTAPSVAPAAAWTIYGTGTGHTAGLAAWATTPPEIAALANSLGANRTDLTPTQYSQNVFDYVRNNIAVEFRFGLGKGARGALIDQSGTPFDQAELMVTLLRIGGVTANFKVGTISPTVRQFGLWTGLVSNLNQANQTFTVDAEAACNFLADGGIPAVVNGSSDCSTVTGNLTSVTLGHIWVAANNFFYDPSFKQNYLTTGIDLGSAMGCTTACDNQLQTAVLSGSNSGNLIANVPYLQNLNEAAALSKLDSFAQALQSNIASINSFVHGGIGLQYIVGGATLDTTYSPAPAAALPYPYAVQYTWSGNIPNPFRTLVKIGLYGSGGTTVKTFYADELAGRRIRDFWTSTSSDGSSVQFSLYVDDVNIVSLWSTLATPVASIEIDHPYAANNGSYATETMPITDAGYPETIIVQIGEASQSSVKYMTELQSADPSPFSGGGTGECTSGGVGKYCRFDDDPVSAVSLMAQMSTLNNLAGNVVNTAIRHHHRFGVLRTVPGIGGKSESPVQSSFIVDVGSAISVNRSSLLPGSGLYAFEVAAHLSSMLEGALRQQVLNSWEPLSGSLSFIFSNRAGHKILSVPATSMTNVIPLLSNYDGAGLGTTGTDKLQALADAGYASIMPQDAALNLSSPCAVHFPQDCAVFHGHWNPEYEYRLGSIALLVHESLKGGGDSSLPDPSSEAMKTLQRSKDYNEKARSLAKVDQATGDFTLTPPPDLVTGDGNYPKSLPLQRSYNSGATVDEVYYTNEGSNSHAWSYHGPDSESVTKIGGGWTHNYQVMARLSNNPWTLMGQDEGIDASGLIAGIYTMNALISDSSFQSRVSALFADYWMSRQFLDDVAEVTRGSSVVQFKRLPDGTFIAPPGSPEQLVQTGSRVAQFDGGGTPDYDYTNVNLALTDKDGAVTQFNWSRRVFPYGDDAGISNDPFSGDENGRAFTVPEFKANSTRFPDGSVIRFIYQLDAQNAGQYRYHLTGVSNSYGRSLSFNLVESGSTAPYPDVGWRITSVTDDNGRTVGYTPAGCAQFQTNNGGGGLSGFYQFLTCPTLSVTLPDGRVEKYDYTPTTADPENPTRPPYRLRRWFSPLYPSTAYETVGYDALFRISTITDILNHTTTYYPSAQFPTEYWKRTDVADPLGNVTSSWFDQFNDNTQIVDPLGYMTTMTYGVRGLVNVKTYPEGNTESYTYDVRGNMLSTTRNPKPGFPPGPIVTSATYEEGDAVWTCQNPASCNKPATRTDGNGNVTNYTWGPATGLLKQVLGPADENGVHPEVDLGYNYYNVGSDSAWALTSKTERVLSNSNLVTQYGYGFNSSNNFVLQTATVDPGGLNLVTKFTFDQFGNVTQVVDPRGNGTQYSWDTARRLTLAVQPDVDGDGALPATQYDYDDNDELTEIDKGKFIVFSSFVPLEKRTYGYDRAGHKILEQVMDGTSATPLTVTQYNYDADDRPYCTTVRMNADIFGSLPAVCALGTADSNGNDRVTYRTYDAAGHNLVEYRAYHTSLQEPYARYTYTPNGKQATVKDAKGNTTTNAYDGFDRLSALTFPDSSVEQYQYDNNDNRTQRITRQGDTINYTYNAQDREIIKDLPNVTGSDVYSRYDLTGHKLFAHYGSINGWGVAYVYDVAGRLKTEQTNGRALNYTVDPAGNRTGITWPDGLKAIYTFDALNRMSTVTEVGSPSTTLATYSYDKLGRRTNLVRGNTFYTTTAYDNADRLKTLAQFLTGTGYGVTYTMSYIPSNQIGSRNVVSGHSYDWTSTAVSNSYTANNLNQYNTVNGTSYSYDGDGNLLSDGVRTFQYDMENRLISASAPTPVTIGYDPLGRLYRTVASGATTVYLYSGDALAAEYDAGTNTVLRRYVPGPTSDEPIVWYEGADFSARNYLHADNQGTVVATTTDSGSGGAFGAQYRYSSYGEPNTWTGSRFRYTGQIIIPEAQLYYYKARMYDPRLGRFLQTDPIGYKDDLDLYAYVGNDPVSRTDPSGKSCSGVGDNLHCVIDYVHDQKNEYRKATDEDHKQYAYVEAAYTATVKALLAKGTSTTTVTLKLANGETKSFGISSSSLASSLIGRTMIADPGDLSQTRDANGSVSSGAITIGMSNPKTTVLGTSVLFGPERYQRTAFGHEGIHDSPEEKKIAPFGDLGKFDAVHQQKYDDASRYLQGLQ